MDLNQEYLSLNTVRRFGVELEINAFDMRNRPLGHEDGALPEGIHYVGNLIQKTTTERVIIHKWGYDHNNNSWVVKPDASCGIEICTPVLKGWLGIKQLCKVVQALSMNTKIKADHRCSFHVHVDVSDLDESQIAKIISWWIKCEPVFMDVVPLDRKRNQYCQVIGLTDILNDVESDFLANDMLIKKLGVSKYYTLNVYHYYNKKRKTIEFRIMDSECCLNPWIAKNYVRLILHFVETCLKTNMPIKYEQNNKWSGYCWLDPFDVFDFLGFMPGQFELSAGIEQVRSWFLARLLLKIKSTPKLGVMSDKGRSISHDQILLLSSLISAKNEYDLDDLYSSNFRI